MRLIIGLCCLAGSIHLVREAMANPTNQSVGKLLMSLPLMILTYIFLRKIIFGPLEKYGYDFFAGGIQVSKFDSRFKHIDEHLKKGELKKALEGLNAILKKYPKFKQAQIRKIQLLGNNFYEIQKALEYSKEVLSAGPFNRSRMDILIIITAMLRKHGFRGEAANLSEEYRQKAKGKMRARIERMEETRRYSTRSY